MSPSVRLLSGLLLMTVALAGSAAGAVAWHATGRFDVALGYEFETWNDVLFLELFADDVNPAFAQSQSGDVTWDGASVGLGYRF